MATDVARKEEDNVTGLYIFVNLQEHNELDERLTKQVFVRLANSKKNSIFARVLVSISPAESHEERSNSITYWKTDDPHPGCGNKHVNYFHDISSGLGNKGRIEHGVDLYISRLQIRLPISHCIVSVRRAVHLLTWSPPWCRGRTPCFWGCGCRGRRSWAGCPWWGPGDQSEVSTRSRDQPPPTTAHLDQHGAQADHPAPATLGVVVLPEGGGLGVKAFQS